MRGALSLLACCWLWFGCGPSQGATPPKPAPSSLPAPSPEPAASVPAASAPSSAASSLPALPDRYWIYVGTYTSGIHQLEFDTKRLTLTQKSIAKDSILPSFLAIHPNRRFLYAVNEVNTFKKQKGGGVSAYAIDPKTGALSLLNHQPSGGQGPCHLSIDPSGKFVLVANYVSGSAEVLPILDDGSLGEPTAQVQQKGKSVNAKRQGGPHAHHISASPDGRYVFVPDLGADKLFAYRFDASTGTLAPHEPGNVTALPGSGPRHFAFHPNGGYAYLLNELKGTILSLRYDPDAGTLTEFQRSSTLPASYRGGNLTAEIKVHPSGKFLYSSNRGNNSIAMFSIDPATGELHSLGHEKTRGRTPRNFNLDPSGQFLLVANQYSDDLALFSIDPTTGTLSFTGTQHNGLPSPVCITFLPIF